MFFQHTNASLKVSYEDSLMTAKQKSNLSLAAELWQNFGGTCKPIKCPKGTDEQKVWEPLF